MLWAEFACSWTGDWNCGGCRSAGKCLIGQNICWNDLNSDFCRSPWTLRTDCGPNFIAVLRNIINKCNINII